MDLDEAIQQMSEKIMRASPDARIQTVKMSDEEARMSVYATTGDLQKIKDAAFQSSIDMLNRDGLDIQVFVYDRDAPPLTG